MRPEGPPLTPLQAVDAIRSQTRWAKIQLRPRSFRELSHWTHTLQLWSVPLLLSFLDALNNRNCFGALCKPLYQPTPTEQQLSYQDVAYG